jgi:chromosome segregation ATPase
MPSLVFSGASSGDFTAPLDGDGLIVGSGDGSSLLVEHRDLSPCHAEITLNAKDGAWWVRDLGSVTGTFLNGVRVKSERVRHGDEISFGSIVARFEHKDGAPRQQAIDPKTEVAKQEELKLEEAEQAGVKKVEVKQLGVEQKGAKEAEGKQPEAKPTEAKKKEEEGTSTGSLKQTEERHASLSKEVEALNEAVRGRRAEREALQASIAGLAKEKADAESALQERVAQLKKQEAELGRSAERQKQAEGERAQLAADVERLSGLRETLTAGRAALEEAIAGHQTEHGRLGALVAELTSRHAMADAAFKESEQRRAQLLGEIGEHEATKAGLEAALEERGANLRDHDKALAIAMEDARRLSEQRATLSAELEALKVAVRGHQVAQEAWEASIAGLAKEKAGVDSALDERVAKLEKVEADLGGAAGALKQTEEQHAELLAEVEALRVAVRRHRIEQETVISEKAETLRKTESQRAEAQRELDRLQAEHQKLSVAARRLEAAVEGRTVEEERLREILRAHEARSAEIASGVKAQEAELRERKSACESAGEALTQAKEHHALLLDEIGKFESQIRALTAERDGLGKQRASLLEENADLGTSLASQQDQYRQLVEKRTEALRAFTEQKEKLDAVTAALADLQMQHQKSRSDLERATVTHKAMLAESEKHGADARAAQEETARCRAESARQTALAQAARQEIESLSKTNEESTALLRDLNSRVAATSERLAGLSDTEERLLQARAEFEDIRQQYGRLSDEVARLGAERDATREHHLSLEAEIGRMGHERSQLEGEIADVQARHQETVRSFEQYHSESTHARRLLGAEIAKVEAQISNAQSRHESVRGKVEEAQRRQAELVEENRRMEAAVRDLGQVEEDIRISELIAKELEERRQSLAEECADAQRRLDKHHEDIDACTVDVKALEAERTRLQKEVAALTDGEKHQRSRFAELQSLNRDAEQVAIDVRAKHEESINRLSHEVLALEARLTRTRGWHDELEKLYGEVAELPESSPEARGFLEQIHERKETIVSQLLRSRAGKR